MITTIMTTADTILMSFGVLAIIAFIVFIAKVIYDAKNHNNDTVLTAKDYDSPTEFDYFKESISSKWIYKDAINDPVFNIDCYEYHSKDDAYFILFVPKTPENDFKYMIKINKAETFERWSISEQEEYFENIEDCIKFANSFNA